MADHRLQHSAIAKVQVLEIYNVFDINAALLTYFGAILRAREESTRFQFIASIIFCRIQR